MAPLRYKGAVTFTGGSATIEYDEMETAARRYTVTFDLNYTGAANPPKPQEIGEGGKATQPAVPARTGYAFGGWFTDAAGTGAAWDFGTDTVKKDITLYAKWTQGKYTVTFDTGGVAPTPETLTAFPYDDTIEEPAVTKTGYTLDGWYKDAAKTAKWAFGKDTVKGDITLYGTWKQNTYKVTFDLNYTGSANPPPYQEIGEGGKATQPAVPARTGYTFGGWFTDAAGTGAEWDFALNTVKETITLYAKWKQITYAVTFNAAGGTPAIIIQSVPYGGAATRPANPTRTDYDFDDWYAAADFAAKWNFDSIVTADITLYAKWKPLTFDAVIADMAMDAAANSTSASYTLPSGSETYTTALNLTTTNSPATVVIDGGGRAITGSANRFTIGAGVTITLKNITFKTVPFTVATGGTLVLDSGAVIRDNAGTGVRVSGGTLEMKAGALVTGNGISETVGSGVRLEGTGSKFTMNGGEISGNRANGGIWWYDGGGVAIRDTDAVFTMNGGSIHDNTSACYGGGILVGPDSNNCTLNLTGGEIYNNSGGWDGGGVWIYENLNATFNMSGGKIRDNRAVYWGGGLTINSGNTFNMTGGEITGNFGGWSGGGVWLASGGTLTGSPQIGGANPGAEKGWIHGNTPNEVYPAQ